MDNDDWQFIKIHNSAAHYRRHLHSTVEEADLRIPVHAIDCIKAGYTTSVVISNDTYDSCPTVSCAKLSPKGTEGTVGTGIERQQHPLCAPSHSACTVGF